MLMNYPSKHLLLRRKGKLLEHSNSLKGFRNILTAAVVSQRRCLPVDNILFHQVTTRKVTVPEGDDPSGYITEPNRHRAVLSAKPVL